jgi:hypothetical protein
LRSVEFIRHRAGHEEKELVGGSVEGYADPSSKESISGRRVSY